MELEQRVKYALAAFAVASIVLAALGFHAAAHVKALEFAGGGD
jgi:hypothetical protein